MVVPGDLEPIVVLDRFPASGVVGAEVGTPGPADGNGGGPSGVPGGPDVFRKLFLGQQARKRHNVNTEDAKTVSLFATQQCRTPNPVAARSQRPFRDLPYCNTGFAQQVG